MRRMKGGMQGRLGMRSGTDRGGDERGDGWVHRYAWRGSMSSSYLAAISSTAQSAWQQCKTARKHVHIAGGILLDYWSVKSTPSTFLDQRVSTLYHYGGGRAGVEGNAIRTVVPVFSRSGWHCSCVPLRRRHVG